MKCFRANDGLLYLVSARGETPVQGPYKTVEQVKAVASALRTQEWADEIARLESEPQPADEALPVFLR